MIKKLKGYRTVASAMLLSALPLIVLLDPTDLNLSPRQLATYTIGVLLIKIYLRMKTTTPFGKGDAPHVASTD